MKHACTKTWRKSGAFGEKRAARFASAHFTTMPFRLCRTATPHCWSANDNTPHPAPPIAPSVACARALRRIRRRAADRGRRRRPTGILTSVRVPDGASFATGAAVWSAGSTVAASIRALLCALAVERPPTAQGSRNSIRFAWLELEDPAVPCPRAGARHAPPSRRGSSTSVRVPGRVVRRGRCGFERWQVASNARAGARADSAFFHGRDHRHLPLRCARALRRVRR
jgi:hypothetical protein